MQFLFLYSFVQVLFGRRDFQLGLLGSPRPARETLFSRLPLQSRGCYMRGAVKKVFDCVSILHEAPRKRQCCRSIFQNLPKITSLQRVIFVESSVQYMTVLYVRIRQQRSNRIYLNMADFVLASLIIGTSVPYLQQHLFDATA